MILMFYIISTTSETAMTSLRNSLLASALLLAAFVAPASAQQGYYAAGHYAAPQAQAAYAQQQAAAYAQNQAAWTAYYRQQQANAQAWAAYHAQQAAAAAAARSAPRATPVAAPRAAATVGNSSQIRFDGRFASVGASAPAQLQHAVYAANTLQNKPYVRGGGHASVEDSAYDCSGSVSYVLIKAGLLRAPLSSSAFSSYGEAGPGRYITIWVKPGEHVFMTICGLRMDTSGQITGEGPRWRTKSRSYAGFTPRHPAGF
jgi:cell wall-associated NlpC family hydrolase